MLSSMKDFRLFLFDFWAAKIYEHASQRAFNLCDTSSSSSLILMAPGTNDGLDTANGELEKYLSNCHFPLCYKCRIMQYKVENVYIVCVCPRSVELEFVR